MLPFVMNGRGRSVGRLGPVWKDGGAVFVVVPPLLIPIPFAMYMPRPMDEVVAEEVDEVPLSVDDKEIPLEDLDEVLA